MEVHKRIDQELDDLLFEFNSKNRLEISFDQIDEIIENIKTVALRRF